MGSKPKPVDRSRDRITFCSEEPEAIDEICNAQADIHIERLSDGVYWMRIGDDTFSISTRKRGKCIITKD